MGKDSKGKYLQNKQELGITFSLPEHMGPTPSPGQCAQLLLHQKSLSSAWSSWTALCSLLCWTTASLCSWQSACFWFVVCSSGEVASFTWPRADWAWLRVNASGQFSEDLLWFQLENGALSLSLKVLVSGQPQELDIAPFSGVNRN